MSIRGGIEINSHFILGEEIATHTQLSPAPRRFAVGDYYNVVVVVVLIIINIAAGVRVYRTARVCQHCILLYYYKGDAGGPGYTKIVYFIPRVILYVFLFCVYMS